MKTYFFIESDSPKRGFDVRITLYRVKRNQPHQVGHSDHQTASWKGARGQAVTLIHELDRVPYDIKRDGEIDRYSLRGLVGFGDMYKNINRGHNAIRLFDMGQF